MEKVPGVDLYPRWNDDIPSDEFGGLIRDLVKTERRWVNASLSGIGSLYFARDLPPTILSLGLPGDVPCHEQWGRFVIGPSVVRKFWKGGRSQLSVDRGPWNELRSEISAAIRCGIEWLRHFARPYPRHSPLYRNERDNSPATHIDVLQRCLHIIPYLPDPPEYSTFCVWHPDLNPSNIIVDETGPLIPRCYLDWQTATVNALLDISVPSFLRYGGGKYVEAGLGSSSMPELPAEFKQLPETEQTIAKKEQRLAARSNYYHFVTEQWNPALHAAQLSRWQEWFHILLEYPQHTFKQALIDMCKAWDDVAPGTTCPISFDSAEVRINEVDFLGWAREQAVQLLREKIGLGPDGWVKENELKDAKRRNREALEQTVAELDHEEDKAYIGRRWPFQDGVISSTAETCR